MTTQPPERDELRRIAAAFPYPPTPPIAAAVMARLHAPRRTASRPARRIAAAALLAILALLAVPEARAALWAVLRIGAIQIVPPDAAPAPRASIVPAPASTASPTPPPPTPVTSVLDLAGETTLADAQTQVGFPIRLPTYPADLGPPDRVFVQDFAGPVLILVWLDPADASKVRLSLHEFGPNTFAEKLQPRVVRETTVNGGRALWASGPHLLQSRRRDEYVQRRLVNGHVLIWTEGEMTYRLENTLDEEEAIRVAESLQ